MIRSKKYNVGLHLFVVLALPLYAAGHSLPHDENILAVTGMSPSVGQTGTRIIISGRGFAVTGNTILLVSRDPIPAALSDGVLSNLSSSDGKTIAFSLPAVMTGMVPTSCSEGKGLCPAPTHKTVPGNYVLAVVIDKLFADKTHNHRMISNWVPFEVKALNEFLRRKRSR